MSLNKPGSVLQLTTPEGSNKGRISLAVNPDGDVSFVPEKSINFGQTFESNIAEGSIQFGDTKIMNDSVVTNSVVSNGSTFSLNPSTGDIEVLPSGSSEVKTYADKVETETEINDLQNSLAVSDQNISNLQADLGIEKTKIATAEAKLDSLSEEGKEPIAINSKQTPATVLSWAEINAQTVAANSIFSKFYDPIKDVENDTYNDQPVDEVDGIDIQVSTLSLLDVLKYAASIEKELRLLREKVFPNGSA